MLLTKVWRTQPGNYFCIATKTTDDPPRNHFFTPDQLHDLDDFIHDHADKHLYWCPHSFTRKERKSAYYAEPSNMLWADLDAVNPRDLDLPPTYAWETSPKRYAGIWLLDGEPTKALRRNFNKAIGADAGWHLTKLLRIPGTRNHKYPGAPRGRVLWVSGPTYSLKRIAREYPAPTPMPNRARSASSLASKAVLDKHAIKGNLRDQLLHGRQVGTERRHRKHWDLACGLHEAGVPREEAFICLRDTDWNKHKVENPDDPDKWVWKMIDKIWR